MEPTNWTERALTACVDERMSRGYAACFVLANDPLHPSMGARRHIDRVTRITLYVRTRMVRGLWKGIR